MGCIHQSMAASAGWFLHSSLHLGAGVREPEAMVRDHPVLSIKKVDLRKRSTTATKNYIVETRQGPAPTNVPSEVQCKDRWYVGSLFDQARHQSGM